MANSEDQERVRIIASVAGVLFVLLAVVIFMSYAALIFESEQRFGNYWTRMRLIKALEFIPKVLKKSDMSVIMTGSSEIDFGVNIEQFQKTADNCDTKGIAFSFRGYHDIYQPLNHRLSEIIQPFSDKVRSIFAFVPMVRLTHQANKSSNVNPSYLPLVYSHNMLMDLFASSRGDALSMAFSKYFLRGMRPSSLAYIRRLNRGRQGSHLNYWTGREYLDPDFWSEASAGFLNWEKFLEPEQFANLSDKYGSGSVQRDISKYLEKCCALTDNDLDYAELDRYLDSYENLLRVTKSLYFIYIPYRNDIKLSSTGLSHVKGLERAIRNRKKFKFLNVARYINFNKSDYRDVLHLSDQGAKKLSTLLAKVACGTQEIE